VVGAGGEVEGSIEVVRKELSLVSTLYFCFLATGQHSRTTFHAPPLRVIVLRGIQIVRCPTGRLIDRNFNGLE